MKRRYYPNNWKQYKDSEDKFFKPIAFNEFMSWKIDGWELPNAVTCIIRAEGKDGKITEHTYQTQGHAKRKIEQLVKNRQSFVVCDNDAIQNMRTPT